MVATAIGDAYLINSGWVVVVVCGVAGLVFHIRSWFPKVVELPKPLGSHVVWAWAHVLHGMMGFYVLGISIWDLGGLTSVDLFNILVAFVLARYSFDFLLHW